VRSSQLATLTCAAPSCSSTSPLLTRFNPLAARSSVDLPEPDNPTSTQIWPLSTRRLASNTPTMTPNWLAISERVPPSRSACSALARLR